MKTVTDIQAAFRYLSTEQASGLLEAAERHRAGDVRAMFEYVRDVLGFRKDCLRATRSFKDALGLVYR